MGLMIGFDGIENSSVVRNGVAGLVDGEMTGCLENSTDLEGMVVGDFTAGGLLGEGGNTVDLIVPGKELGRGFLLRCIRIANTTLSDAGVLLELANVLLEKVVDSPESGKIVDGAEMGLVEIGNTDLDGTGLDNGFGHFRKDILRGARWVV